MKMASILASTLFPEENQARSASVCPDSQVLAVADAKLEAFTISQDLRLTIKVRYTV